MGQDSCSFARRAGSGESREQRLHSCGIVTVVQEHRFELLGDDGTRRHFTLAHDAPLGWKELIALQHDGCRVAVRHDAPRPGHTTAAVHAMQRLAPGERLASGRPPSMENTA
jgi:hypothetical protein